MRWNRKLGKAAVYFNPEACIWLKQKTREYQLRLQAAKAKFYGMNFHEISRDEAERLHPLVDYDGGAMHHV